jgi:hypothetical protein
MMKSAQSFACFLQFYNFQLRADDETLKYGDAAVAFMEVTGITIGEISEESTLWQLVSATSVAGFARGMRHWYESRKAVVQEPLERFKHYRAALKFLWIAVNPHRNYQSYASNAYSGSFGRGGLNKRFFWRSTGINFFETL